MSKNAYYTLGKIEEKEKGAYFEYTLNEARKKMLQSGTHGPWEIDFDLCEKFDKIGMYGIKISTKEKKILARTK